MISYVKKKKDLKNNILEVVQEIAKIQFWGFIIALLLGGLFLVLGFTSSPNLLDFGLLSIIVGLFLLIFWVMKFSQVKKMLTSPFLKTGADELNYSLEVKNGEYIISNYTTRQLISFNQIEIKKISFCETLIIVHLTSNDKVIFPKNQDILRIFQQLV